MRLAALPRSGRALLYSVACIAASATAVVLKCDDVQLPQTLLLTDSSISPQCPTLVLYVTVVNQRSSLRMADEAEARAQAPGRDAQQARKTPKMHIVMATGHTHILSAPGNAPVTLRSVSPRTYHKA